MRKVLDFLQINSKLLSYNNTILEHKLLTINAKDLKNKQIHTYSCYGSIFSGTIPGIKPGGVDQVVVGNSFDQPAFEVKDPYIGHESVVIELIMYSGVI